MAQCIAYIRVSTRGQGWGHGLVRQLECIQSHAKETNHWIRSVYCDIGSGTKPLPQRALAIAESRETGYPLFVEAVDRFTRLASDIPLFEDVEVVVCGKEFCQLEAHLVSLVKELVNGTP